MSVRLLLFVSCLLVAALSVAGVHAAPGGESERALELYRQGRAHFLAKRYAEAIASLSQSIRLVESPNSALLLGHAYREQTRSVEAIEAYEKAEALAKKRLDGGAEDYRPVLEEAAKWVAALRKDLCELLVRAPPGAEVRLDGVALTGGRDDGVHRIHRVWRVPGEVDVTAMLDGAPSTRRVRLEQGAQARVDFEAPRRPPPVTPPPPAAPEEGPSPLLVSGLVVGGVGLIGVGLFAGFAVRAQNADDELADLCGVRCSTPKERAIADEGKRDLVIANVSLGVGAAAVATGAVLLIVEAATGRDDNAPARVGVGPSVAGFDDAAGATLWLAF
jgi:serine/threonine-protein kinase